MSDLGFGNRNSPASNYYNISVVSSSETAFVVIATPQTNGGQDNDLCGTFAVDQVGPNESGIYASIAECW